MSTSGQNFPMYSGDTVDINFTVVDADGNPLDLSGLDFWWGMGSIVKNGSDQIDVSDHVCVFLLPEDTVEMSGAFKHQLRAVDPIGRVETFAFGTVQITASVFQPGEQPETVVVEPTRQVCFRVIA